MPLFEFRCEACEQVFEKLVRPQDTEPPVCPACGGAKLERLLSSFAVDSEAGRQRNLQIGRAHAKKANRDKNIAEAEHVRDHIHGHDHSH